MAYIDEMNNQLEWLGKDMRRVRRFREFLAVAAADDINACPDDEYYQIFYDVMHCESQDPSKVFSALIGWDIMTVFEDLRDEFGNTHEYKMVFHDEEAKGKWNANWDDTANSIDLVIQWVTNVCGSRLLDEAFIRKQDKRLEEGVLCHTVHYTITKIRLNA